MKKALKTAARGTVFPYAGEKWVVLEHDPAGRTLCLRLEVIPDKPFDEDNRNNFAISSSKEWMNGPYLDNLIDAVKGPHAFLTTELDLTADDGLKDYGTCTVTIFSLTVDQYRRNRDVIPLVDDWYWLSTAYSTAANGYEHSARYVRSDGTLNGNSAGNDINGVRPALYLKSDISVSLDGNDENTIDVSEEELYKAAVQKFGEQAQILVAIEEMSELTKVLLKYIRHEDFNQGDYDDIVESIAEERADVSIMLNQLAVIFGKNEDAETEKLEHLADIVKDAL